MSVPAIDPYDRTRAICVALPEVTERDSHGEATWLVGKRTFVTSADRHHDDRRAVWLAAAAGVQETLVGADPDASSALHTSVDEAGSACTWMSPSTGMSWRP